MVFEHVYNNYARDASLVDNAMFLKESLHGVKRNGGVGGGVQPPPICTHDVFITGSERGHMGSVFADRMILAVALYSLKKRGGWGGRSPPVCKWTASMMGLKSSRTMMLVKQVVLMVRCV